MPPTVRNLPHQMFSGPFSHVQQPHLPHHGSQHPSSASSNLPPPSFNAHHSLTQGNPSSNFNAFSQTGNGNGLAAGFGGTGGLGGGGTGLASQAAVMGFAHGAALQQQQQAREQIRRGSGTGSGKNPLKGRIRDVWRGNLAQEMQLLRSLVDKYPYISMVSPPSISALSSVSIPRLSVLVRTPSSLVSLRDPWAHSQQRRITTIRP